MLTWPAKDPAATYDYRWQPPLDPGDKLASATVARLSGDVTILSQSKDDAGVTVILSGGSVGQNLFHGAWLSAGGRSDDEYISIEVQDNAPPAGQLVATLKARYSAFAGVNDATIAYWITDAARFVDASWPIEADREPAQLAAAAHAMARANVTGLADSDIRGFTAAGVTDFKSGTFSARFSDAAVAQSVAGGWASTPYGQEYATLLDRNKGGGGVTSPGTVDWNAGFNGFAGRLPNPAGVYPWG